MSDGNLGAHIHRTAAKVDAQHYAWPVPRLEKELADMRATAVRYRDALALIANTPDVQRNPDGDDQAAATMKLIARDALHPCGTCGKPWGTGTLLDRSPAAPPGVDQDVWEDFAPRYRCPGCIDPA